MAENSYNTVDPATGTKTFDGPSELTNFVVNELTGKPSKQKER